MDTWRTNRNSYIYCYCDTNRDFFVYSDGNSYIDQYLNSNKYVDTWRTDRYRNSRRRFLKAAGTGVAGAASLALVGCGGDDDDDGPSLADLATPTPGAGPTAVRKDPFAGAKKGGVFRMTQIGDAPTIDPYGNFSYLGKMPATFVYSRLFQYKAGPGIKAEDAWGNPSLPGPTPLRLSATAPKTRAPPARIHQTAPRGRGLFP